MFVLKCGLFELHLEVRRLLCDFSSQKAFIARSTLLDGLFMCNEILRKSNIKKICLLIVINVKFVNDCYFFLGLFSEVLLLGDIENNW